MIEKQNLKYLITEEIYVINESSVEEDTAIVEEVSKEIKSKTSAPPKIHEVVVWTHELTNQDEALLKKMLEAVKLDLKNVHLIHQEQEYSDHFKVLLSFGHINFIAEKTKKEILLNEPLQAEGKSILVSYPISSLHEDVEKKGALWNGLKKLFTL